MSWGIRVPLTRARCWRRIAPFPAGSTANLDACALPRPAEAAPLVAPGRETEPEPDFARWICYWGKDSDAELVTSSSAASTRWGPTPTSTPTKGQARRDETIEVAVEDTGVTDPETLCGPATTLARAIADRLPTG